MKHNIYDLFSGYTGELPELKDCPCDTERIKQLVSQKKLKRTRNGAGVPAADTREQGKMFSMAAEKSAAYHGLTGLVEPEPETDEIYILKGVDSNMKKNWRKPAVTAAACLLLVGGVIGGAALLKKSSGNSSAPEDSYYASVADEGEEGRRTVTIGLANINEASAKLISDYNRSQEDYWLEAVNYSQKSGRTLGSSYTDSYAEEFSLLQRDIISGNAPDIIAFDTDNMFTLINKGMFCDMFPFMDEPGGLERVDILPNMLEGFEIDGRLPAIGTEYRIYTAAAKTKFVGNSAENWTVDKFIETAESLPEGMHILNNASFLSWNGAYQDNRQNISYYALLKLMNDCVDRAENTCNFSDPSMISALEYSMSFPDKSNVLNAAELSGGELDSYSMAAQWALLNDRALVGGVYITGLGSYEGQQLWSEFGEDDLTFVGYPSSDGNGAVTEFQLLYGIPESSSNKEGAWDAVSYFISEGNVSKAVLDKQYNTRLTEKDSCIYSKRISWDSAKNTMCSGSGRLITQERIDQLYNYIQTVKVEPYSYGEIDEIIKEEVNYVLGGDCTAKQAAERIQSRCSILLSENS
ncbi:MAG: hypothetical protein IKO47_06800 [Ruminococcus sp.]|nr:hypothetical protein [Ruminococcus sp.]